MKGKPLLGRGGALFSDLHKIWKRFDVIKKVYIENAHRIGGSKYGADIMGIPDVFQDDRESGLPTPKHLLEAGTSTRSNRFEGMGHRYRCEMNERRGWEKTPGKDR